MTRAAMKSRRMIGGNGQSVTEVGPDVSNDAASTIIAGAPYTATVEITGTADILFHRWSCEGVKEKASAVKGSAAKRSDDIESYVYRASDGTLAVPGVYLCRAIAQAAKFRQDPRSPRKSAMDLFVAGVVPLTALASLGVKAWDYEHKCRVMIQRNGITRTRPALKAGWRCEIELCVNLSEYISDQLLQEVIESAGRLIGIGDFRPSYGRFRVTRFNVNKD